MDCKDTSCPLTYQPRPEANDVECLILRQHRRRYTKKSDNISAARARKHTAAVNFEAYLAPQNRRKNKLSRFLNKKETHEDPS